jgi:hypothetical protein
MKKIFVILLIMIIVVGCGGSGGGSGSKRYDYKWSNGSTIPLAYLRPSSLSSVVYAADEPAYIGSEIPPFSSWSEGGYMGSFLLIFTYYGGVRVSSTCTIDPADGEVTEYDLGGGDLVPSVVVNRQGLFRVTATYEGNTLDIPVRIYHFGSIWLENADLDSDGIKDIENLNALFGYRVVDHSYLSLVFSAPGGEYSPNAPLVELTYGKIYIIKTSSGRYCKFWPTGSNGPNSYNGMDFLSDENGNFAY